MKVAITLNDVLREHYNKVVEVIEQKRLDDENSGEVFELDDDGEIIPTDLTKNVEGVTLDVKTDNYRYSLLYPFEDEKAYNDLIYDSMAFTIYGRPVLSYPEANRDLNKLYSEIIKEHSCTIVSQERSNSKIATLNFLSVSKIMANNYKFLYDYSKIWQLYDVVITANPFILKKKNLKNENKLSVKIITEYNKDIKADYEFNNLSEVLSMF